MSEQDILPRSPNLMSRDDSAFLLVDAQERLLSIIPESEQVIWNLGRLLDGARILRVPVRATEQYPAKLGGTVPELADRLQDAPVAKMRFSCGECGDLIRSLADSAVTNILVAGVETHVCVMQTAMDLMTEGFDVYVPADAVTVRKRVDHDVALARMQACGVTLTTTESILFEWCEAADIDEFKQISALVKQAAPSVARKS